MQLSRRRFLGTAGTLVALPFLESLLPRGARAAASAPPLRLIMAFAPNGMYMPNWTPTNAGAGYDLPSILQPLSTVQSDVSVLTNLQNANAVGAIPGDHARGMGALFTCVPVPGGSAAQAGISADQVVANAIGANNRFKSLQLLLPDTYECDFDHSCVYNMCVSWADANTPLLPQSQPVMLFGQMFEGRDASATAAENAQRAAYKKSVLDSALAQAQSLQASMSASDKIKLDQYFTSVRSLETALAVPNTCAEPAAPVATTDIDTLAGQMVDLLVLALQCDLTRVATLMLARSQSHRGYPALGFPNSHHGYSHHAGLQANINALLAIDQWEVALFTQLVTKLGAVQESNGRLLDNTAVLLTSELSDGNAHTHQPLPVLLAGKCGGALSPGRHVIYSNAPDIGGLYLSLFAALGASATGFGSGITTPLPNV